MSEQQMPRLTRLFIKKKPLLLDAFKTAFQDQLIAIIWAHLRQSAGNMLGVEVVPYPHVDLEDVRHFGEILGPVANDEGAFIRSWAYLMQALHQRAPALVDMLGPHLDTWLPVLIVACVTGENDAVKMLRLVHQLPGSVRTIGPDGGVHGLENADLEQRKEVRAYFQSLRPAKPGEEGGRPSDTRYHSREEFHAKYPGAYAEAKRRRGARPRNEDIARALGISLPTLQRYLSDYGRPVLP